MSAYNNSRYAETLVYDRIFTFMFDANRLIIVTASAEKLRRFRVFLPNSQSKQGAVVPMRSEVLKKIG